MADLAGRIRAAVDDADVELLRATFIGVLDLHGEHAVRDRAGGYLYSICSDCCMDDDDNQSPACRDDHEHFGPVAARCWPCSTWHVAARCLGVRPAEEGLL